MIITLQLDDDLAQIYQEEAAARTLDLKEVLVDRLRRAEELDPRERYLIIVGNIRGRLETKLGGGHLKSPNDLLAKVERLAKIRFGDHEILLSAGQMEELVHRSKKQGKTIDQMLKEMWQKIQSEFFEYVP